MKDTFRHLCVAMTILAAGTACSDSDPETDTGAQTPVVLKALNYTFESGEGSIWKNGETFGVFMLKEGTTQVMENYANLCYTADNYSATGYLIPGGEPMYYPADGTEVDIVAYHPYSANTRASGYQIAFDLSDQKKVKADDFIYSNEGKSLSMNSGSYELQLKPVLTRIVMNLVPGNGISEKELATAVVALKGVHTTASFDLLEGTFLPTGDAQEVTFLPTDGTTHQAVLFPGEVTSGMKLNARITRENGTTLNMEIPLKQSLTQSQGNVEYEIALKVTPEGLESELESASYIYILDWQDDKSPMEETIKPALPNLVKDARLELLTTGEWQSVTSVPGMAYTWYGMANQVEGNFQVREDDTQGKVLSMKFSGTLAWYRNYLGYTSENAESASYQLTFKARANKAGATLKTYVRIHQTDNLFFVLKDANTKTACAAREFTLTDAFTTYVVDYDFSQTVNTINSTGIVIAPSTEENRKSFYLAFMATEAEVEYQIDDVTFIKLNK